MQLEERCAPSGWSCWLATNLPKSNTYKWRLVAKGTRARWEEVANLSVFSNVPVLQNTSIATDLQPVIQSWLLALVNTDVTVTSERLRFVLVTCKFIVIVLARLERWPWMMRNVAPLRRTSVSAYHPNCSLCILYSEKRRTAAFTDLMMVIRDY